MFLKKENKDPKQSREQFQFSPCRWGTGWVTRAVTAANPESCQGKRPSPLAVLLAGSPAAAPRGLSAGRWGLELAAFWLANDPCQTGGAWFVTASGGKQNA